jgi:hypothetical protein
MTIDSVTPTEQTMAITDVFSPNDVRTLVAWGDAMRNLVGWCSETRQPIGLHLYVDDATLSRIWCKSMRFQCPHCGIKHETKVGRLASTNMRQCFAFRDAPVHITVGQAAEGHQRLSLWHIAAIRGDAQSAAAIRAKRT